MDSQEKRFLTVPLTRKAHTFARGFAAEQATAKKGKQVFFNTLAVYAMYTYLQWLRVETDLNQSQSWNPAARVFVNASDLFIPNVGSLECCPVLPGEKAFSISPDLIGDRIGYAVVELGEDFNEVRLVGFIKAVDTSDTSEEMLIADIQPMETLLDCIPSNVVEQSPVSANVKLSQWFQNVFEAGWQTVETLFSGTAANPIFSFRSADFLSERGLYDPALSISCAKKIDLGIRLVGHPIALIVTIAPQVDEKTYIRLWLCPSGNQNYLPPGLQMIVCDKTGASYPGLTAQARSADNWMQLQFKGQSGEHFSVKLVFNDASITEYFVI